MGLRYLWGIYYYFSYHVYYDFLWSYLWHCSVWNIHAHFLYIVALFVIPLFYAFYFKCIVLSWFLLIVQLSFCSSFYVYGTAALKHKSSINLASWAKNASLHSHLIETSLKINQNGWKGEHGNSFPNCFFLFNLNYNCALILIRYF